jgi:WD40 repeat protein
MGEDGSQRDGPTTVEAGAGPSVDFSAAGAPVLLLNIRRDFNATPENFVKSVAFSPDGTAVLANSDDNKLRMFDVPPDALQLDEGAEGDISPALCIPGGECVHDCCWWPCASALEPSSFVFLAAPRAHPLHLLDGITGRLRASYRCVTFCVQCCPSRTRD